MNKGTAKAKKGSRSKPKFSSKSIKNNILLYNRKGESRMYLVLSFLIPFILIWYFFAQNEVHPFGDKQILVTDLWHQYYPFFRLEQEKLQSFSSFLYSWDTGLGTNFISLMSYYAASPLNFLSIFFPIEYSRDLLTLFLTIKIGCAGLFFAVFLKHTFNKNDFSITAFAICYALCDYIMGYYWNVIWMDTVALLPLVVLGTVKLYKEGKYKLYVISLALSLISSFYIGLFTCIFTVMVFAALVIIDWGGFRYAFKRLGQIAGATAIGIGIGAVILIPAFLALMLSKSMDNTFPTEMIFYEEWRAFISSVIGFHEPTAKEGMPNFYCGMFAVILLGALLRSGKIKIREKIVGVIYIAFIIVSCNMNILNYMWHGFHVVNMLPYRFAFLLSFILLALGYRAFTVMTEEANLFDMVAMAAMAVVIALVSKDAQPQKALISSLVVCFIFVALMFVYERKLINKKILGLVVLAVCSVEMGMNVQIGVETVSLTDYKSYPRKKEEITALIDEVKKNDDSFYRIETTSNYSINDPALYGYRGVSQFSSTANVNVTNLMHDLGIYAYDAGNRYYYCQNTPVFNMFTNLKYLISAQVYSGDLTYLEPTAENSGTTLFTNKYHLPLGFTVKTDITDYEGGDKIQFENQNELFRLATGIDKDVLKRLKVKDVGHKGLNVVKSGYGNYNYQPNDADGSGECYLKYNYTVSEEGPVYATFDFDNVDTVKIKSEDIVMHSQSVGKYTSIFAAGNFDADSTITLQADVDSENSGNGYVYAYQIDKDVFEEGYKKLLAGGLDITDYSDTKIEGSIEAQEDCMMYTSIPYDGGWTVYVDGKKTEVTSLKDALMCVPLSAGKHDIKMTYCPPGFITGLIITISALALFVLLWVFEPKMKLWLESRKKISAAAEENVTETAESE
ncbi:MAG: YfhO family protein [Clostridium sp.]|nr:YfhO family protein [Clostridium sp.]MCM1547403.1 YfhO family protein [Ruminococcus sp.]